MFDYIDKLRKKPEPERRKTVLFISIGVTLVVAIIWGVAIGMRISGTNFTIDQEKMKEDVPSLVDTFSNFFNQVEKITSSASDLASTTAGLESLGEASSTEGMTETDTTGETVMESATTTQ